MTVILTTLLEIFATSEKLIKDARIKQYLKVTFLGSNEKVAAAMTHLKELMDAEEKLVVSLTYSTTQRMESTVERTERTVEKTEQTLGGIVGSLNGKAPSFVGLKAAMLDSLVTSSDFLTDSGVLQLFVLLVD